MGQTRESLVPSHWIKVLFAFACGACIVLISMIRSEPVYGKLDFILVDSKNWWHEMRHVFEEVSANGDQPIITDRMTGFLFERCFGQQLYFTQHKKYDRLSISRMDIINRPFSERATLQSIYTSLLLAKGRAKTMSNEAEILDTETLLPEQGGNQNAAEEWATRSQRPYRCVINLKGFTPTWVPIETRHWRASQAQTSGYYYLPAEDGGKPVRGYDKLVHQIEKVTVNNCRVYK